MASGDLTATALGTATTITGVVSAITGANLAAATDSVIVSPLMSGLTPSWIIVKVEREA